MNVPYHICINSKKKTKGVIHKVHNIRMYNILPFHVGIIAHENTIGVSNHLHTQNIIQYNIQKLIWSRLGREKRSNLIVCHSSTACSEQLQLPNDAASYDPTGNQSGLPSHAPQLSGLLSSPSSLFHSLHSAPRLPFSQFGPCAGRKELKAPLSV